MKKLQNHSPSHSQHKEEKSQGAREYHMEHEHLSPASAAAKQPLVININLQFDPAAPFADEPTRMVLIVAEQRSGEPVLSFEKIHDKLMHFIIVNSSDLSSFAHLHVRS
jgi:hypothetical protein